MGYVEEALCCFSRGCSTASVLLLGVAAEAVVFKTCELIVAASTDPAMRRGYDRTPDILKKKHRWLVDRYNALPAKVRRAAFPMASM